MSITLASRALSSALPTRAALIALLLAGLSACGGDDKSALDGGAEQQGDGGTGGDSSMPVHMDPPPEVKAGELGLRVDQARRVRSSDGTWGQLEVAFSLANGAGSAPASLNFGLFQVKTSAGLYVAAYNASTYWVDGEPCNASISVAGGSSFSCTLTIDLADDQIPIELYYRTANKIAGVGDDQREATAPFSVEACTECESECTYLDRDSDNCGACGSPINLRLDTNGQNVGSCLNGKPACPEGLTLCGELCSDLTSGYNCGKCGARVYEGTCNAGAPMCYPSDMPLTTCGDESCIDTTRTLAHCGGCNKDCSVKFPDSNPSCEQVTEAAGRACRLSTEFDRSTGDLKDGDTCQTLCKRGGYDGCAGCDPSEQPVGSDEDYRLCGCYWKP
jgi:hypothetical protein